MIKKIYILLIFALLFSCENDIPVNNNNQNNNVVNPIKTVSLKNHQDTVTYSLGVVIGTQMQNYGITDVDYDILSKAIEDVLTNSSQTLPIDPDVAKKIVNLYAQKTKNRQQANFTDKNSNFLTENINNQGVIALPNGMQYKIIEEGQGTIPTINDKVTVNFTGKLVDGTVFSNTFNDSPVEFIVKNSLKGWQEALTRMHKGAEWIIYLPPELAYGTNGSKNVPPNSVVIYQIQLLDIK